MSATTLRIIIGFIMFVHGIGHAMAFVPALNLFSTESWHYRSWLLSGFLGDLTLRIISIALFGLAMIGFIASGLALFGWLIPHEWWRTLSIVSAVMSLVTLTLFWNSFASLFPNKIGAIAVNVAILVSLLWTNWPLEADIGY